jgi:hypothetical protein
VFVSKLKRKKKNWLLSKILLKNASKRKGFNGKWIMDLKYMHVKNEIFYT